MSEWNMFDGNSIEGIRNLLQKYENSKSIINKVIVGEGAEEIKKNIAILLPSSGRKWKGKAQAAKVAMPGKFSKDEKMMAVTIAARNKYHYLYFPDDGSNTKKHAGNQHFMLRGAELSTNKIIDLCLGKLNEQINS